jgi:VIT1/CCC1 family predicted Fe2+/Mn2+ transporter
VGRDEKQQPHGPAARPRWGPAGHTGIATFRAAGCGPTVFGAVDGLVTNASLISGLGGGGVSAHTVVLTGVASLVAGAFSMGTGEFISVTNQNELVSAEVSLEQQMLTQFPAAEEKELAGYFRDYGADPQTAARLAAAVALAAGGMAVGRLTGRPVLWSGLLQLAFGALAIAVTYLVGHLIGSGA